MSAVAAISGASTDTANTLMLAMLSTANMASVGRAGEEGTDDVKTQFFYCGRLQRYVISCPNAFFKTEFITSEGTATDALKRRMTLATERLIRPSSN